MYQACFQGAAVSVCTPQTGMQSAHANRFLNRLWAAAGEEFGPYGRKLKIVFPSDVADFNLIGHRKDEKQGDVFSFFVTYTEKKSDGVSSFSLDMSPRDISMLYHFYHPLNPKTLDVLRGALIHHFAEAMDDEISNMGSGKPSPSRTRQAFKMMKTFEA